MHNRVKLNFQSNVTFCVVCAVVQSRDPSTNVVLLEDAAAVLSVAVAATCMGLTSLTGKILQRQAECGFFPMYGYGHRAFNLYWLI